MNATLIAQLVAHSTPSRLPVSTDEHREQRNWAIRVAADLGDTWNPDEAAALLTKKAASAVHAAREARGLPLDDEGRHAPVVRLLPIDGRHLVMSVITIKLEDDDAHSYLVAASTALRALDEVTPIDDIQGIPRRFWGALLGS
jgi:hypothetical protein